MKLTPPPGCRRSGTGNVLPGVSAPAVAASVRQATCHDTGDLIGGAIAASVLHLVANDPVARLGDDPEGVHQARVATRRLRSDLRTFRDFIDPEWAIPLRDELRWLGVALGAVRDAEVLLARLRKHTAALPDAERVAAERVVALLTTQRGETRHALLATLRSARYAALLDHLVDAARSPSLLPEAAEPATATVPRVMAGPWGHLRSAAEALGDYPPDVALHGARIRAKRCRYAAEAVVPAAGKRAQDFARAIEAVQDVLGEHQDTVFAREWLRESALGAPAEDAYAAGVLAGLETARGTAARARFPELWRKASRKRLRGWW